MVLIHQRHRQTDGQTDDMRSQYCAMHYTVSRGNQSIFDEVVNYESLWLTFYGQPGISLHIHRPTVWKDTTMTKAPTNDSYVYIKRGVSRLE